MTDTKLSELSRRRQQTGAGSAEVASAVPAKPAPDKGGGYQVTQHVLDYYQTTRV